METTEVEKIILQDNNVFVSHLKFSVGGKSYAIRSISSVRNHKIEKSRKWPKVILVLGVILTFLQGLIAVGLSMAILGGLWLVLIKEEYSLRIQVDSVEEDCFISKDEEYIEKIIYAIDDAMIIKS